MALVVKDRVKETTSTTGTGTLTLGGAVTGFQTFTSVLSNSDTTYYAIFESSTGQFEVGLGTFTSSGTTLARTTILESSNSGNAINLTAGAADVFITQPAEKAVYLDSSGHIAAADGRNVTNVAASTAATLATARDIGGVSFNGSASINLPGVNTSGNQDTSGNAATATTAGTVTTAAQTNITSLGTLTTLTVDDITINGSTISDGGDFTIDVGGEISIDSDSGVVRFKDGGTQYGMLAKSGNDLIVKSQVSDGDLLLKGVDGGSEVTAVTLDMSAAGAATFNAGANFGGDVDINGNLDAVDNIVLATALYHEGDTDTLMAFGTDEIAFNTGGTSRVYVDNTGVRLGDTGNGYFQPVSGDYGSIQIDGGAHGSWEGYSIGGRAVFMHNNTTGTSIYDDVNNKYLWYATHGGASYIYHNGAYKINTTSTGINVTGTAEVDTLQFSDGSTQTSAGASTGKAIAMAIVFG